MSNRLLSDAALAPRREAILALVAAAIVVAAAAVFARQVAPVETVRALYAAAIEAYDKKDYPAYLKNMEAAIAQRPVHPTFLRRLAGAYALNRRAADAAGVLRKMATLSLYYNALDDPDFGAVSGDGSVQIAARALEALRSRRIGSSEVAWTIHDRLFVPEGIAYDPATRAFFVSSQFKRKIVRIDSSGAVQDFVTSGRDGLWMVFGIAVDPTRRLLWAVSTHSPTGWAILAVATALTVLGLVARYLVPGRRLRAAGVPALTTVSGVVLAVVGFFVIPVVGAFVGFVLGVYLAECVRLRSHRHAWPTTTQALRAIGLSFGIELGTGLLVAGTWVTGVLLTR